jgi:hypothetical protein
VELQYHTEVTLSSAAATISDLEGFLAPMPPPQSEEVSFLAEDDGDGDDGDDDGSRREVGRKKRPPPPPALSHKGHYYYHHDALDGLGGLQKDIQSSLYIGLEKKTAAAPPALSTRTFAAQQEQRTTTTSSAHSQAAVARAKVRALRGQQVVGLRHEFREAEQQQLLLRRLPSTTTTDPPGGASRGSDDVDERLPGRRRPFGALRSSWETPASLQEELARLERYQPKPKTRPTWNDRTTGPTATAAPPPPLPHKTKTKQLPPVNRRHPRKAAKRNLPSSAAVVRRGAGSASCSGQPQKSDDVPAAGMRKTRDDRESPSSPEEAETRAACDVVHAIAKHEELVSRVRHVVLGKCAAEYRHAQLHEARIKAFDELTALLSDVAEQCVRAVQAVARWRDTLSPQAKGSTNNNKSVEPFVWNGENWLLHAASCLDFLAECHELREWYGAEFPLRRNPLSYSVSLDQRVPTPRQDTHLLLIDGEWVEKVSDKLVKERAEDLKALEESKGIVKNAAPWWPGSGILNESDGEERFYRFRAAEKLIRDEERRLLLRS